MHQSATALVGMEMVYELCTKAATFITDRHLDSARGKQASFQDQRRKREEEQAKVRRIEVVFNLVDELYSCSARLVFRLRKRHK